MQNLIQILFSEFLPGIWRQFFLIISVFGFYLSIVIIISSQLRNKLYFFLGLYTASLSVLLFDLISDGLIPFISQRVTEYAGIGSIFLIGPSLFNLIYLEKAKKTIVRFLIHFIPSILLITIIIIKNYVNSSIYISGIIYTGIYLIIIIIHSYNKYSNSGFWSRPAKNGSDKWKSRFIVVAIVSYVLIVISLLTLDFQPSCITISIILSFHIIYIWIRLLATSINNKLFKQY